MDTTQISKVMDWLWSFGNITSMDAIEMFGATRLSAIIYSLRHHYGYNIITKREKTRNRYGNNVNYARYYLVKENKNGNN
ncbi:MAG: helix-turn-helix domain-containing protein [Clostridia bacterium]|nr:helix-turn-helix domain-containing protein [Clostridia bacterium]